MFTKKSQMEILGLAIVVVLILIATIFVVRFIAFAPPANYRNTFVSAELASNTLNTFLRTSAGACSQLTMTELLQDCAQAASVTCDNGENSCDYAESTAKSIFSKTLNSWNMSYEFLAYTNINEPYFRLGRKCSEEFDKSSKQFPIPTNAGTMYVKLDICGVPTKQPSDIETGDVEFDGIIHDIEDVIDDIDDDLQDFDDEFEE